MEQLRCARLVLQPYIRIDGELLQGLFGGFLETPETRIEISAQEQRNLRCVVEGRKHLLA